MARSTSEPDRRILPNFLGIGVPRAGTTWLHALLATHPEIYVPQRRKEVSFFDRYYGRGFAWYGKFFPEEVASTKYTAIGEITPYYFFCNECPERIASAGVAQLILMLREPAERAWSYYGQKLRNGVFSGSFEEFLVQRRWPVVEQGYYSRYLRRYLRYFSPQQMLVLVSEDVFVDPSSAIRKVAAFLGVAPEGMIPREDVEATNRSYLPKWPALYALAFRASRYCRERDWDWLVNVGKRAGIKNVFGMAGHIPVMSDHTRARLATQFAADTEELEQMLGISLDAWRKRKGKE